MKLRILVHDHNVSIPRFILQAGQKYRISKKFVLAFSIIHVFLTFEQTDTSVRLEKEFFKGLLCVP